MYEKMSRYKKISYINKIKRFFKEYRQSLEPKKYCACGCGQEVNKGYKYIKGHNGRGKKRSYETRQKISAANKKYKPTEKALQRLKGLNKGRKHSAEARYNMGAAHKGHKVSVEARRKIGAAQKGKKVSAETKQKLRLSRVVQLEKSIFNGGQITPNYNPKGCRIIDEYGKKHGLNFVHAENGGEFQVPDEGYFLDGYDKEKNVAIEIDEPKHFDMNGDYKIKDIERQKRIEKKLGCRFIRIKVDKDGNIIK